MELGNEEKPTAISAKQLSKRGYATCLFPEQPRRLAKNDDFLFGDAPSPPGKYQGISAKKLTAQGYSVCFFPEQPRRIALEETNLERKLAVVVEAKLPIVKKDREQLVRLYWRNRLIYMIALISFSLSLHNVYHFPFNIHRFGTIFIIPYTLVTILIGYPLHILQTSMGQYAQLGSLWIWYCAPIFFGVGIAMILACIVKSMYYNIFAAYALIYMSNCFDIIFPWTYCPDYSNRSTDLCLPPPVYISSNVSLPSRFFFYEQVLNTSLSEPSNILSVVSFKWWIFLALLFSWTLIYVVTLRSCRSIGKVAVVIVITAYFTILSLLVVVLVLRKSKTLNVFQELKNVNILNVEMWVNSVMQVLLELGICYGIPIVYGSYCRFRNSVFVDSFILCLLNYLHSLIFAYLFLAFIEGLICRTKGESFPLPDNSVILVYLVYSEAFTDVSGKHYWCLLFFFMLFLIIIGTQIGLVEAIFVALQERFPSSQNRRRFFNLAICVFFFLMGMFHCFDVGYFDALRFDSIPSFFVAILVSWFFLLGILIVYGITSYAKNMKLMMDLTFSEVMKICFYLVLILLTFFLILQMLKNHTTILYNNIFTQWKDILFGLVISAVIVCPLGLFVLGYIIYAFGKNWALCESTEIWTEMEKDRKDEDGEFSRSYSPSYTWEWNQNQ